MYSDIAVICVQKRRNRHNLVRLRFGCCNLVPFLFFTKCYNFKCIYDSSVGIGMSYELIGWDSIPDSWKKLLLPCSAQTISWAYLVSYPLGTKGCSQGRRCKADHSLRSSNNNGRPLPLRRPSGTRKIRERRTKHIGLEVPLAAVKNVAILWHIKPYSPYADRRFGRMYHLHVLGRSF